MKKERFGVMLDCSRNAAMNVVELKKFIDTINSFGYNTIMLYTEETYEVNNEPYFGYLRARFSKQELKEIDAYCTAKGMELIPCVQTLAHLNCIFKWEEYRKINDVNDILLAEDERTYKLIENIMDTVKECFSSPYVHVGMDEAEMLGLGKFLHKHGFKNRFEILTNHLEKVISIAQERGIKPIMWSDMFFSLINEGTYYLSADASLDGIEKIKEKIPKNVELVYWDYYHSDEKIYDKMFTAHEILSDNVWFAGGAWTWAGFAPMNEFTFETMTPAMKQAKEHGVKNVLITMWGDDGAECSRYAVLPSLFYIKKTYDGETDLNVIKKQFKEVTGEDFDSMVSLDIPNQLGKKYDNRVNPCKNYLYNDLFSGFLDSTVHPRATSEYKKHAKKLAEYALESKKYSYVFYNLSKLCSVLSIKATLGIRLRNAYKNNDKDKLSKCLLDMKKLLKRLDEFYCAFRKQWMIENKPQGFEIQDARLGGLMRRIKTCMEDLKEYLEGKSEKILELENQILSFKYGDNKDGKPILFNSYLGTLTVNRF